MLTAHSEGILYMLKGPDKHNTVLVAMVSPGETEALEEEQLLE